MIELSFKPMTRESANRIISWQYETPYDVYGYNKEGKKETIDYLIKEKNRFYSIFQHDELIGFRSFGEDGRVNGGDYSNTYLDTGGGLRPDLTGKGLGAETILGGLKFGERIFGISRFRITVADFNQRAKKVCEKIGFEHKGNFARASDGKQFSIFTIDLKIREQGRFHVRPRFWT